MTSNWTPRFAALGLSTALLAAACGGGDTQQRAAVPDLDQSALPAESPAPSTEAAGANQLPQVEVVDLATGENVLLSSFAPADRPIVLWFWAPH